jgi:hypothetical protein
MCVKLLLSHDGKKHTLRVLAEDEEDIWVQEEGNDKGVEGKSMLECFVICSLHQTLFRAIKSSRMRCEGPVVWGRDM